MELAGKSVFVSGANRGIGAALVDALLAAGVGRIYAGMRRPEDYEPADERVLPVQLDVTDPDSVAGAAERVDELHVLINNAGLLTNSAYLAADDLAGARAEMEVNYWGPLYMVRALESRLRASGAAGGAVVMNVMSTLARVTYPFCGTYCASKYALNSLTKGIRAELADSGVRIIEAYPGLTDTQMVTDLSHLPKTDPTVVAAAFVEAIAGDLDEVYVGQDALDVRDALEKDPRAAQAEADQYL